MSYVEICECGCTKDAHFEKKGPCLTRGCDACRAYRDRLRKKPKIETIADARAALEAANPGDEVSLPDSVYDAMSSAISVPCGEAYVSDPTPAQRCTRGAPHNGMHRAADGLAWIDHISLDITIGDKVTVKEAAGPAPAPMLSLEQLTTLADGARDAINTLGKSISRSASLSHVVDPDRIAELVRNDLQRAADRFKSEPLPEKWPADKKGRD